MAEEPTDDLLECAGCKLPFGLVDLKRFHLLTRPGVVEILCRECALERHLDWRRGTLVA